MSSDPNQVPGVDPASNLSSERETQVLQDDQDGSPALADPDIDRSAIKSLPGTGDYTDEGDVEVDPEDLNMPHLEPGRTDARPPA